jgi:hypothetical protein
MVAATTMMQRKRHVVTLTWPEELGQCTEHRRGRTPVSVFTDARLLPKGSPTKLHFHNGHVDVSGRHHYADRRSRTSGRVAHR